MSLEVFVPKGGAGRLAIQSCSRMPDPEKGFGFQEGVYHNLSPLELASQCAAGVAKKLAGFNPDMMTGVILTCANPTGAQNFTGRTIANKLGWNKAWGNLVNQLCMSGLRGIMDAANMISGGIVYDSKQPVVIAVVGSEKMSECRLNKIFERDYSGDAMEMLGIEAMAMGYTAEMTADRFNISEEECNRLAILENRRMRKACQEGWFKDEIVPVEVNGKTIDQDALPEELTEEIIAAKKKYFFRSHRKGGKLNQFTSSQMSDGSATIILCNSAALEKYGWTPMARLVGGAIGTVDPKFMGEGLIAAFENYLKLTGYFHGNQFLVEKFLEKYKKLELNTAFASVPLALMKKYNIPDTFINVAGGATTPIGHPLGATGVRLAVTLLHLLARFKEQYGYAGACVGEGQGGGVGFENKIL
ncbi:MAG: thiolase family protein [Candidatus Brocadiae bacterium]|nr:thiolase family protein [Candidatus Brocadiia bacterium]